MFRYWGEQKVDDGYGGVWFLVKGASKECACYLKRSD